MGRQHLRHDQLGLREFLTQVVGTCLDALGHRLDAGLRREEHVVVADHEDHDLGLEAGNTTVVEPPEDVLGLLAADPDVDALQGREVPFPRIAPLDRDRIADEQHVDGALVFLDHLRELGVGVEPATAAEGAGIGSDWPHGREVLALLLAWAAFKLWLEDVLLLLFSERPARLLRLGGVVGVVKRRGLACAWASDRGRREHHDDQRSNVHGKPFMRGNANQ